MDWYSWLSQTNLDPYLVYEYGRAFTRNELQRSDTNYFTHEFLQSMGVSVAKHRLQILNLASKNNKGPLCPFISKLISSITNTRILLSKKLRNCVSFKPSVHTPPNLFRPQWRSSTKMKSGPLDRRVHESYMSPKKVSSISGPLDKKVQENMMAMYSSPMDTRLGPNGSGPLDDVDYSPPPYNMMQTGSSEGDDEMSSLWSLMFQNIKPT